MNSTFLGLRPPPGVTAQLFPQYLAWDRSGIIAAASQELLDLLTGENAEKVVSDLFIAEDEMFPKACAPLRLVHRESGRRLDGFCVPEPDASLFWFLVAARVGRSTVYPQAGTNLFDVVADRTINGVVMTDRAGRILWINHRFEKITGWTLDEVRGRSPGSFLQGPETDPATVNQMREKIRNGQPFTTQVLNYRRTGERYWLHLDVQPLRDPSGEVTSFLAIENDISQSRRHEQRIAVQLEVSKILAEAVSMEHAIPLLLETVGKSLEWHAGAVWMKDTKDEELILRAFWKNAAIDMRPFEQVCRSLKVVKGQGMLGRVWETGVCVWEEDLAGNEQCPRSQALQASGLHGALCFPVVKDTEFLGAFEFISTSVEFSDTEMLGILKSIGSQVGQFVVRKRAEAALLVANRLNQAILDGTRYSMISTDLDGVIQTFNSGAESLLGYRAAEMVGIKTPEVIHDAREVVMRAAALTAELGVPVPAGFETIVAKARIGVPDEAEWTYIRKDGTRLPVLLSVTGLTNGEGELTGFLGIAADITERRRFENELRMAKEQAESANRAKGDFLATMSHEIRTPMNGIIGMSGLLRETKLESSQRDMVEAIRTSGEALMDIIEDILDFSKIEARRLDLVEETFSLDAVIDGVVDLLNHKIQSKGLTMGVILDPDVPLSMKGDAGRLRQILFNLMGNASKFTDEGEVNLFISVARGAGGNNMLEFTVADTGIGMTPQQIERLFQPFSQVDSSSTRRFGGTGLGLVISKRLVELMGGAIHVESTPGKGSRFFFRLPARHTAPEEPGLSWPEEVRDIRILVAEPHPIAMLAVRNALEGLTHRPDSVYDEESLTLALADADKQWDVLIVDRRLAGDQFTSLMAKQKAEGTAAKLIITGQITDSLTDDRLGDLMNGQLTRPLRRLQLRSALTRLMKPADTESGKNAAPADTPHARASDHIPHMLVVEDNEVNARLAILLLEKLGYTYELARDGAEGLERFTSGKFDAVLMDCHMPVMDGYEATRRIRELEESTEWQRPQSRIIAMTANAMTGERERCLLAGMDDYLAKPLKATLLMETLSRVPVITQREPMPPVARVSAHDEADCHQALRQLVEEISLEAAVELVGRWLHDAPSRIDEMIRLAGGSEQAVLKRVAHSLKGSSSLFGLTKLVNLCHDMEKLADADIKTGQAPLAVEMMTAFEEVETCLKTELENYTSQRANL